MSAPDFYFAVNAIARHLHDRYGQEALVEYWRSLGREYYRPRLERWRREGLPAIADDWRSYFREEPEAVVDVRLHETSVELRVWVCPAIRHLRHSGRDIVPCYCEHCDHICGAMAEESGHSFKRIGGMGSCVQYFTMREKTSTAGLSDRG